MLTFNASNFSILAPCVTSFYNVRTDEFKKTSPLTKYVADTYREKLNIPLLNGTETHYVMIDFDTSDVVLSEEIQLSTLPDFISAIGGNLGLFIGFSCLPLLLWFAESFDKMNIFPVNFYLAK